MTHLDLVPLPDSERYETTTRRDDSGAYLGTVTGPLGSFTGSSLALAQLGRALLDASQSTSFVTLLRVDDNGPLHPGHRPAPDPASPDGATSLAHAGYITTVQVWATAGDDRIPVEPGDWFADDTAAMAAVGDHTDLHFADGRLTAHSRCRHGHIHRRHLAHPDDLYAVRSEAVQCPGHPMSPA